MRTLSLLALWICPHGVDSPAMSIGLATKIEAIKTAGKLKDDVTFGKQLAQRMEREEPWSRAIIGKWKKGDRNIGADALEAIDNWYYESMDLLAGHDPLADIERRRGDLASIVRRLNPRNLDRAYKLLDDMVFQQQLDERGIIVSEDKRASHSPLPTPDNNPDQGLPTTKDTTVVEGPGITLDDVG